MPSCIRYHPRGADIYDASTAIKLFDLDALVCEAVGDPCHPTAWCRGWFNYIGSFMASGKTYDEVRAMIERDEIPELIPVLDYLEANYEPRAWWEASRPR